MIADVRLRPALPDDADALSGIARAAKAHRGYPASALRGWHDELVVTPAALAGGVGTVAERGGRAVAFCRATFAPPTVEDLWVHPSAMGLGLGRRLLGSIVEAARERGVASLAIDADPHAAGFYERLGAVRCGDVPAPIEGEPGRVRPQYRLDVRRGPVDRAGRSPRGRESAPAGNLAESPAEDIVAEPAPGDGQG